MNLPPAGLPRATLRLQFNQGFTFADAKKLVSYFAALGISHVYASPIMAARLGSMHGYDTIDPARLNPELGSADDFERLVAELRGHGMGLIVDIVPNHMAVGPGNRWWMDVLAQGRGSHYAKYFDIDWANSDPWRRGKVLLPVLGRPYGEALAAGEIIVEWTAGSAPVIRYFDKSFPLSPATLATVVSAPPQAFDPRSETKRLRLHALLEEQHYRLAWWRYANDEINWRRFFDVNELAAIRVEDNEVFEAVHATILRFYAEGLIDGVRIDHIDGLVHPENYCRKLRACFRALEAQRPRSCPAGPAYVVVEKILARDERLPAAWETDGTTGYDFMDEVSLLQHNEQGEPPLTDFWRQISGRPRCFGDEEQLARRQILERSFSGQREGLVHALHQMAQADLVTRDFSQAAICRCMTEILAHFPVYRIYSRPGMASTSDRDFLSRALALAEASCLPGDRSVLETVGRWLIGERLRPDIDELQAIALTRFEQLSAPLCAKAVEDTAFYRYGRLISRNDVGFDAGRFACTNAQFHAHMRRRLAEWPGSMLATATHDHKRGEDVRARVAVLSECSQEWGAAVARWLELSTPLCVTTGAHHMPSRGDLAILFQTIVGAWPMALRLDDRVGLAAYAERIAAWQQKALREAKLESDWTSPNEAYEQAAARFVEQLFLAENNDLIVDIARFAHSLMPAGAANSLAQLLIKLTAPGVPDIYQGTEFWDQSLVDPDNRGPVDFAMRQRTLHAAPLDALTANWKDGRIKQYVIAKALALRQRLPDLFTKGDYRPLVAKGPLSEHVAAFARVLPNACSISVFSRFSRRFLLDEQIAIPTSRWGDARLVIPDAFHGRYADQLTRQDVIVGSEIDVAPLLQKLPICLLVATSD
jgi:malto-oligosyltrehalose synthase